MSTSESRTLAGSHDALVVVRRDGTIVASTSAADELFGGAVRPSDVVLFQLVHVDDHAKVRSLLAVDAPVGRAAELRVDSDEGWKQIEATLAAVDGDIVVVAPGAALLALRSIERTTAPRRAPLVGRDPLTNLVARPLFVESVRRAFALGHRKQWGVAVFAINVDNFHRVNDEFGYDAGDEVLVVIADRLRSSVRDHDTRIAPESVTRIGADHFFVMCEAVPDAPAASRIARRLFRTLTTPLTLQGRSVALVVSIGVSFSLDVADPEQFILDAEAALRHAEQLGGGRYQFFDAELQQETARAEAQIEALRRAIANDEFRLVYQPKVSLTSDRMVGVEALLRWDDPQLGLVGPADFIPAAEASGLVVEIGAWVFREACRQAAAWRNEYPRSTLTVAINVSARQFKASLAELARRSVNEAGLDPSSISVEMTETTVMDDIDATVAILRELKRIGLTVSIDDFGTGYSSLEYLHRMPIDEVKIDRSFIEGLGVNSEQSAIVASVISLAQAMQREVVAEGVETAEQLERLRSLGCDLAQGYFISPPLPPEGIAQLIAADAAGERLLTHDLGDDTGSLLSEIVLIVDDAADVRQLALMSLTAAGFMVEEAGSGAAGLAIARRLRPSCVLLDLNMPGMSGIDVCKELRSSPEASSCTIVMLTTSTEAVDKAEAFLMGADDYIVKPFAPRDLISRVRAAIKHRRETVSSVGRQIDEVLLEMVTELRTHAPRVDLMAESEKLSTRQLEVLKRLLAGERVPTIARALYLSQSTVRNHLSVIFHRLGVHSQEELIQLLRSK